MVADDPKCQQCGAAIVRKWNHHDRPKKFCSVACRGLSQRTVHMKACERCGKEFKNIPSNPHKYCSNACRGAACTEAALVDCKCRHCGKEFKRTRSTSSRTNYCDMNCFREFHKKPDKHKKCTKCGIVKHDSKMANTSWCKQCSSVARSTSMQKPIGRHKYAVNNARIRGLEWSIPMEDHIRIIQMPCHYCGGQLNIKGVGLDRLDNNRGYHLDNVVPCCGRCNRVRGTWFTYDEMKEIGLIIAVIDRRRKEQSDPDCGGGPDLV